LHTETDEGGLEKIEEETDDELVKETINFDFQTFTHLSIQITTVLKKMKKIIGMFNKSNDLTRDLREAQKYPEKLDLMGDKYDLKSKSKCILNLIQDIVTR